MRQQVERERKQKEKAKAFKEFKRVEALKAKEEERESIRLAEEEEEAKRRKEEARAEAKEFEDWKGQMEVEEEGSMAAEQQDKAEKIEETFVLRIKEKKIMPLIELSSAYGMTIEEVVDKIRSLEKEGLLVGVMDDRGKYISFTRDELSKLAEWVRRKGLFIYM